MGAEEEQALLRAGEDIMSLLGKAATYIPVVGDPVSCTVHYDAENSIEPGGYDAQATRPLETIEGLYHELGSVPEKGDRFVIDLIEYTVQSVLENDGIFIMLSVK